MQQKCKRIIDDLKTSNSRKEKFRKVCRNILLESDQDSHKQIMKDFRENLDPSQYITDIGFKTRQYQPLERMLREKSDYHVTLKLLEEVLRHDLKYFYNFVAVMVENSQKELFMALYEAACRVEPSLNCDPTQASQDEVEPVQEVGGGQGPVVEEDNEVEEASRSVEEMQLTDGEVNRK